MKSKRRTTRLLAYPALLVTAVFFEFGHANAQYGDDLYYDPSNDTLTIKQPSQNTGKSIEKYTPQSTIVDSEENPAVADVYNNDNNTNATQDVYGNDRIAGNDFSYENHFNRLNGEDSNLLDQAYYSGYDNGYDKGYNNAQNKYNNRYYNSYNSYYPYSYGYYNPYSYGYYNPWYSYYSYYPYSTGWYE